MQSINSSVSGLELNNLATESTLSQVSSVLTDIRSYYQSSKVYDDDDNPVNAIDLSDGTTLYYESFVNVTPLDAELNY